MSHGDEIRLYDCIGGWGTPASEFVKQVTSVNSDTLTVYISSPGGDVFDGLTMMNSLRACPAEVTVVVEGIAASAASVVAVGGADRLIMRPGAELMIHDAWAECAGDAAELTRLSEQLERTSDSLAQIYADKAGGDPAVWRAAMRRETWYSADEAVEAGLADAVEDGRVTPRAETRSPIMARFNYSSRAAAPPPPPQTLHKGHSMEIKNEIELLTVLKELLAKLVDGEPVVAEPEPEATPGDTPDTGVGGAEPDTVAGDEPCHCDETPPSDGEGEAETEPAPEPEAEPEVDESLTVLVDKEALAELQALAEYGRQAKARESAQKRAEAVDAAIRQNKIPASARARWTQAMEVDEEDTRARLARIPVNTIPRAEVGYGVDPTPDQTASTKRFRFTQVNP